VQAYADPLTGLAIDSSDFRKRAPRLVLSSDPDTATVQTVQEMCRQIHEAARDPLVKEIARRAVATFKGGPGWAGSGFNSAANPRQWADSCWWWCKWNLKFKHHGSMFEAWSKDLGDPQTKLQLLIAPDVLVRMKRMEGDCAIYTMMLCAMLESLGIQWQIVTLAADGRQPTIFSHVFPRAAGETLDASHGSGPGWEVPLHDQHRRWAFDQRGSRVSDSGPQFSGLHAYRRTGRRGIWGLGDVCAATDPDFDPAACVASVSSAPPFPASGACTCVNGTCLEDGNSCSSLSSTPVPTYTAPASNSAQWASFASQMLKGGLTLAQINAIQPGTVVSANGAILRQNPGYSVPAGGTTSLNAALGGNTLMYLGLGLVALVVLPSLMGGRR
jgi:hypothetical protein